MKLSNGLRSRHLVTISLTLIALASLSYAAAAGAPTTAVNIVNNSSSEIRNVYASPPDSDNWSNDLLGESSIAPGQSTTLSNISCAAQQVKVIAEDQDGCFLSTVVACGQNTTWTIVNETARDCGY
jgi:hypothetical protein